MITFKEFLELVESSVREKGKKRLPSRGPSKNLEVLKSQKSSNTTNAALSKAGFRRKAGESESDYNYKSSSPHHETGVTTYKNQSHFAADVANRERRFGKSKPKIVSKIKGLRIQLGGDRTAKKVHGITISSKDGDYDKNDSKELITRRKSFKKELRSVPNTVKSSGGKSGEKVVGEPMEMQKMPSTMSTQQRISAYEKGKKIRGRIYQKMHGGSKSTKTGYNAGTLR
jgi:hypothetical protein